MMKVFIEQKDWRCLKTLAKEIEDKQFIGDARYLVDIRAWKKVRKCKASK